jgi:hypothetical protein
VKSSPRAVLALAAVLGLSLGLKVWLSPYGAPRPQPVSRDVELRQFLQAATAAPVEPEAGGWRFQSRDCRALAFTSGPRGGMEPAATSHRRRGARMIYLYRGRLGDTPPGLRLTVDVIGYYLVRPFRSLNEPGYVVLLIPDACPAVPNLPWARLPVT